jgi:uncharacterized membrane protein
LSERLSEQALAWVGAAGLALGGALLVGFMAQQGILTPPVRLAAATVLGLALLGVSEGVRRKRPDGAGPMTSALAAGAGAATLYAVIWAAQALYGYVGAGVAAGLLAGVAGLLLALSLVHGRALALLAVASAFVVPLVTGGPASAAWSGSGAVVFALGVLGAGLAVSAWRGWTTVAALAIGGALLWSLALVGPEGSGRAIVLALAAALAAVAYAASGRAVARVSESLAAAGLLGAGGVLWLAAAVSADAGVSLGLIALTCSGVWAWRRALIQEEAAAVLLLVGGAGAVTGVALQGGTAAHAWSGAHALALAAAVLWASRRGKAELVVGVAAFGAAALAGVSGALWSGAGMWALPGGIALALAAAATLAASCRHARVQVDLWAGAAAAALLIAASLGATAMTAPPLLAGCAGLFALLHRRLGWTSLAYAAVAAAAETLGAVLNPAFLAQGWGERELAALGAAAGAGAVLWAVSRSLAARGVQRGLAEAVETAAVVCGLVAAFVGLNALATAGARPLDVLVQGRAVRAGAAAGRPRRPAD